MEESKISMFVSANSNKFNPAQLADIRSKLETVADGKANAVLSVDYKDCTTMLVISIFLGYLGVDSFMLGKVGIGVLKLLTCGCCGILWIIDIVNIKKNTQDYNYQKFNETINVL